MLGTVDRWDEANREGYVRPDSGGPEVWIPGELLDGANLEPDTRVSFEVEWLAKSNTYGATRCEVDSSPRKNPFLDAVNPDKMEAWSTHFGIDGAARTWLAGFPSQVQKLVMEKFNPEQHML